MENAKQIHVNDTHKMAFALFSIKHTRNPKKDAITAMPDEDLPADVRQSQLAILFDEAW